MSSQANQLEALDDYLTGIMDDAEAAPFEEALFDAALRDAGTDARASALAFLDGLSKNAGWFASRGGFLAGLSRAQFDELRTLPGVHYLDLSLDNAIPAWPSDTALIAYRVPVDLRGYEHAEVELLTAQGEHVKYFRDVLWDPDDGALYAVCDPPLALGTFRMQALTARIEGTRAGKRELVATVHIRPA